MSLNTPLLSRQCEICRGEKNLLYCGGCKAVSYCQPSHQVAHRDTHKRHCKAIQQWQIALNAEEAKLHSITGDPMIPDDVFEEGVGYFWSILETRPYMRSRFALTEALLAVRTSTAVKCALDHLIDMLRLCRGDNMGLRSIVPSLMLRLDMVQECYDFVKWWFTCGTDVAYDWGDMSLPYLDIQGADVFEPCSAFLLGGSDLGQMVAITLLKIKLLINLQSVQNAPQADLTRQNAVRSLVLHHLRGANAAKQAEHIITDIKKQVRKLYDQVNKANPQFWTALITSDISAIPRPAYFSRGGVSEMQVTLRSSYASWVETPGAVDIISVLVQDKGLDAM